MIIKKKVKRWLNKFKPGTRFTYKDISLDLVVDEENPHFCESHGKPAFSIHTKYNLFPTERQYIWGRNYNGNRFENNVIFYDNKEED